MIPFIVALMLFVAPALTSAADWPNRPAGLTTIVDCPFSGSLCPSIEDTYHSAAFAQDSTAPLSPPATLETFMSAGSVIGNGQWGVGLSNARELYVGTWWNPDAQTMGNTNGTNKLLFGRNNSAGDNSFLGWMGCAGCVKTIKWYFQHIYCNRHIATIHGACKAAGDGTGWAEPNGESNGQVAAGSGWHRLEFYLRASTGEDTRDGILRWWLDGKIVGNYPGINISPKGFEDFQINHTWDGFNTADRDKSKRWSYKWDHLVIATGGGTGPVTPVPPTPPSPPPPAVTPGGIVDMKIRVTP